MGVDRLGNESGLDPMRLHNVEKDSYDQIAVTTAALTCMKFVTSLLTVYRFFPCKGVSSL